MSITDNAGRNRFFALPLLLGIAGLVWQFRRSRKDAAVTGALFLLTGLALVFYLNMDPMQVRERDYVFVGSFYAFAIWIGLGVPAIASLIARMSRRGAVPLAFVICLLAVPALMAREGWADHNRSGRFTARDMAMNYLTSCAPNAILFTFADNDTYPLWYLQSVEGVRKDVRLVNLSLMYEPAYVAALKRQVYDSAPLPVTMADSKYAKGTREYLPFSDVGLKDSVELSDLLDVLLSDDPNDKIRLSDGTLENFLPAKKWKLAVDKESVKRTRTVPAALESRIADTMEWTYNKNFITRGELAVMDILVHNDWKRPVYFTSGAARTEHLGLTGYLYNEGYTSRLLPLKPVAAAPGSAAELLNVPVMTKNLLERFRYSFRSVTYLDPESRNTARFTWDAYTTLAARLIEDGDRATSRKVMDKAMDVLPLENATVSDTVAKYLAATNYYRLGDRATAAKLLKGAVKFLGSELDWYASLDDSDKQRANASISYAASILQACGELARSQGDTGLAKTVDAAFRRSGIAAGV